MAFNAIRRAATESRNALVVVAGAGVLSLVLFEAFVGIRRPPDYDYQQIIQLAVRNTKLQEKLGQNLTGAYVPPISHWNLDFISNAPKQLLDNQCRKHEWHFYVSSEKESARVSAYRAPIVKSEIGSALNGRYANLNMLPSLRFRLVMHTDQGDIDLQPRSLFTSMIKWK